MVYEFGENNLMATACVKVKLVLFSQTNSSELVCVCNLV